VNLVTYHTDQFVLIAGVSCKGSVVTSSSKEQDTEVETTDTNGIPHFFFWFISYAHLFLESYIIFLYFSLNIQTYTCRYMHEQVCTHATKIVMFLVCLC
jgi:hypothetical protein